ncbi:hypothetical protein ACFYSC_19360 [Streptosporangium sp. NPDC004379]|uniref:hypothetical protein n=1 Tax=Streptosporangium sp. NPDC004379 TaxID=3366189 RepID=UPI0036B754C9
MNEHAAPEEAAEAGDPTGEDRKPAGEHRGGAPAEPTAGPSDEQSADPSDEQPPAPRGIDGESRVVAERSGADTTFPDRPLPADLLADDLGDLIDDLAPDAGAASGEGSGEATGERAPQPEMGPAS